VKYLDQKRAAAQYHRDLTGVNIAKGLELSQRVRGKLLTGAEYDELEASAILTVYMVQLHVTGLLNDEAAQRRLIDRARKLAEVKLREAGSCDELDVEVY
jgi:hypothetical protein